MAARLGVSFRKNSFVLSKVGTVRTCGWGGGGCEFQGKASIFAR